MRVIEAIKDFYRYGPNNPWAHDLLQLVFLGLFIFTAGVALSVVLWFLYNAKP